MDLKHKANAHGQLWVASTILVSALIATGGCTASSDQAGSGSVSGGFGGDGGSSGTGAISGNGGWGGTAGGTAGTGGTGGTAGTGGAGGTGGGGGDPRRPIVEDYCQPSGVTLTAQQVAALGAGGPTTGMRFLYPYNETVFPRGTQSPDLMWEGPDTVRARVRIHASLFDHTFCTVLSEPGRITLAQHVWEMAGQQTRGTAEPYTIEITTQDESGNVSGPISTQIEIAHATLSGSIYYNSYSSPQAPNGGAVMRIQPRGSASLFVGSTECVGCHSVSANGARLIVDASGSGEPPPFWGGFGFGGGAGGNSGPAVYAITPTTQPNPTPLRRPAPYVSFAGLSPDGSVYIASAPDYVSTASAFPQAGMFETDSGLEVLAHGIEPGVMMPSFSPDGRRIVFTDVGIEFRVAPNPLVTMDYDPALRRASNRRLLAGTNEGYNGWPFYLPDNQAVIYTRSLSDSSYGGGSSGFAQGVTELDVMAETMRTELYLVDVKSEQSIRLDRAMGHNSATSIDDTDLPFVPNELGRAYYPTVSPVAAGGYFWEFFDSVRNYGNRGPQRQLWGTAVSISPDGSYTADPSHPPFYLPGQEFGTGNHRAFTALDPCRGDGTGCTNGIDCCSGFCLNNTCGTPEVPRCSETNETCEDNADCCNSYDRCFAGFCGTVVPD